MNNKNKLIILLLVFSLLIIGTGSASGLYNDSATVAGQDMIKSSGVRYALLVGVSTYQDPSNNLEGVQYDVPHMRDMLINDCGYSSSHITTLQDSQATKSAIRAALLQMSSQIGKDDTFVFYFSGHGYVYPSYSGTSYIEPYDSRVDSLNYDISSSELKQWLDGIHAGNVLVTIDACEAEGMLKGGTKELVGTSQVKAGGAKTSEADLFSENFLGEFGSRNGLVQSPAEQQKGLTGNQYVALISCRTGEGSWTNAVSGSWFTTYLAEGVADPLTDTNSDKWVSAEEAFNYASPLTTFKHNDQHPVIYDGNPSSDLLMAYYGSASTGSIDVRSNPTGARIYLDGLDTGFSTPKTFSGVIVGTHTIRCTMSGYIDKSQSITVNADQTTGVSLTLQSQAPVTGSISVSSSPTGARIYLDGADTGFNAPRIFNGITTGPHTIRCTLSGYGDQSQSVMVNAGKTATVRLTLPSQAPVTGSISVSSSPTGSRIFLDGADTGYSTPATFSGITVGTHIVRCTMNGYGDQSGSVMVNAGKTATVRLTLPSQAPVTGSILVSSSPTGAAVYLDGKNTGSNTPVTLSGISAGSHTIRCSMNGYTDKSQMVIVKAGQTTSISLILPVQASATGSISVSSSPTGARIYLDGVDTGYTTPGTFAGIKAGIHTVRCALKGYNDQSQSVTVSAGKTMTVKLTLPVQASATGSIYVSSSPAGVRIYLDGIETGYSTPATLSGISVGSHTVLGSLSGYTDQSQGVTVNAGQTSGIVLNLPASSGISTGSIYVTSQPSRALVYLDGKYLGVYTPTTISKLTSGTHEIRLTKYGYKDLTRSVTVTGGLTTPVSAVLNR